MNTSAGRLGVVSVAAVLGLVLSSCGGHDARAEPGGADGEPSTEPTSSEGGVSETEQSSGDGGETEEPESSPTPVPASSDGPAQNWPEPEIPDEIYEETEEGALAALRYWFEASTYLQLTGDAQPLISGSSADCVFCEVAVEQYEYAYEEKGAWYVTDHSTVEEATVSDVREGFDNGIFFDLREAEFRVYDGSGEVLGSGGGELIRNVEAHMDYAGDRWIVIDIYPPAITS